MQCPLTALCATEIHGVYDVNQLSTTTQKQIMIPAHHHADKPLQFSQPGVCFIKQYICGFKENRCKTEMTT